MYNNTNNTTYIQSDHNGNPNGTVVNQLTDPTVNSNTNLPFNSVTNNFPNNIYNDMIDLSSIPEYDTQDYDLLDEKDFKHYITDIEKIIRSSIEYRLFVNYLREYMNMNKCSFFQNVSNEESTKIRIHLHHSPLTLYDIVRTVYEKRMFYGESLEVEMVAKEVMYVHYFLMVGIIPLSETVHELVHDQLIFIPMDRVLGNYEEFLDTYKEWIPEDVNEKLAMYRHETLTCNDSYNMAILQQKPIALQLPNNGGFGTGSIPELQNIANSMNTLIEQKQTNAGYSYPNHTVVNAQQKVEQPEEIKYAFTVY